MCASTDGAYTHAAGISGVMKGLAREHKTSVWLESSVWMEREARSEKKEDMVPTGIKSQTRGLQTNPTSSIPPDSSTPHGQGPH